MAPVVLLVDDERDVLSAWSRILRDSFEVATATSGEEALEVLEHSHVGVVVADYRMPGMDGVELLRKVGQLHPEVMRILVTAFMDELSLQHVIEEIKPYRILEKPVDMARLEEAVGQAMEVYEQYTSKGRDTAELSVIEESIETIGLVPSPFVLNFPCSIKGLGTFKAEDHVERIRSFMNDMGQRVLTEVDPTGVFDADRAVEAILGTRKDSPYSAFVEHFDGSGPKGLRAHEIPAVARVTAVLYFYFSVGVALGHPTLAKKVLKLQSVEVFDPVVVKAFLDTLRDLERRQK